PEIVADLARLGGKRGVERIGKAMGEIGTHDERALAQATGAGGGGGRERGFADAALAEVENQPHWKENLRGRERVVGLSLDCARSCLPSFSLRHCAARGCTTGTTVLARGRQARTDRAGGLASSACGGRVRALKRERTLPVITETAAGRP